MLERNFVSKWPLSFAGVAQHGQSVRLIIERSRAQIPPPALFFGFSMLNCVKSIKDHAIFINNAVP